jgi:hypothetical protein
MAFSQRGLRRSAALLTAVLVVGTAGYASAQFGRQRGLTMSSTGGAGGLAPETFPDGDFVICRLMYREARRFANGWSTDYPLGERNLSIRFSELTRTRVSRSLRGDRNHYLVRITDDQLFQCPLLMAGDVGSIGLNSVEAERLRDYLLKGGFLWTDDMWGEDQWETWVRELRKVFPADAYPIEDVPLTDPIFHAQFIVREFPQVPNIGHWRSSGGDTSERGSLSAVPVFRAIRDSHGRIMVAMFHNTDVADSYEHEATDPSYFAAFSPTGYALGVNVLLYALTR